MLKYGFVARKMFHSSSIILQIKLFRHFATKTQNVETISLIALLIKRFPDLHIPRATCQNVS